MATAQANKRLTREYKTISENPPPYIQAHPSESNILEWHYLLTGPPDTPYHNGQYWGTLNFPPDYPFKPPAIRMITPSGRFQPKTRLCLSISDFHPKSFNPAWEVSTILIGLLSFMTSEEMTTGSVAASEQERKVLAARSRWWNSTHGGSALRRPDGTAIEGGRSGIGADGGKKFRLEWEEVDDENWKWMEERRINPATGYVMPLPKPEGSEGARKRVVGQKDGLMPGQGSTQAEVVVRKGESWLRRHKVAVGVVVLVGYVLLARALE